MATMTVVLVFGIILLLLLLFLLLRDGFFLSVGPVDLPSLSLYPLPHASDAEDGLHRGRWSSVVHLLC